MNVIIFCALLGTMIYSSFKAFVSSLSVIITCFKTTVEKTYSLTLKLVNYFTVFIFGCATAFSAFLTIYFTVILINGLNDIFF